MHVDVSRCDGGHPKPFGQFGEQPVAAAVVAGQRALQLDAEALGPERPQEPLGHLRSSRVLTPLEPRRHGAVARAAGEADEPLGVALEVGKRDLRRLGFAGGHRPRPGVGHRQEPAEVAVALARLAEHRQVVAVVERQLTARDRLDAKACARPRMLHRAVQSVVVGQRERRAATLGGSGRKLDRMRRTVQKRECRVTVQLNRHAANHRRPASSAFGVRSTPSGLRPWTPRFSRPA